MPQLLTRLRIDEVSAVDRAAGEGTKIVLLKRDDTPRSKPHVERHARRLRKYQETKYERSFNAVLARMEMAKADDVGDDGNGDDDGDIEKQADHHASTVADLLVESGRFPHRTAALDHLLNSPHGNALLARLHKAEAQTGKDHSTMDRTTELRAIAKAGGIIAVAKAITDENRSYGITEHEFVALATEHAKAQHPELSEAAAFSKLYEIPEVWRACNVLKSMPFVADVTPVMVGGEDTRDLSDTSKAIEQLKQLGRDRWPTESASAQFERALTAPENHKLARRAVPIPQPTTQYPFPR
jgi:hypothetical protein